MMNCKDLISNLGFHCRPLSEQLLRVWSPFTYGSDGQIVALYVEKQPMGYRVSDDAAALMHASSLGINITKSRLEQLRSMIGNNVTLSDGGSISATASDDTLTESIASVLSAALAVGHVETMWLPSEMDEKFAQKVEEVLAAEVGKINLKKKLRVTGASGHDIIVPLTVETTTGRTYIQPVASRDDGVHWNSVYQGMGRMFDLKNAGAEDSSRIIVFEDIDDQAETAKALNILTVAATVVMFGHLSSWARKLPIRQPQ